MPQTSKVLFRGAATTTTTTLYTVPAATSAVISSINVANTGTTADNIRIAIRPAGASLANQHYQVFGVQVPSASVFTWTTGATLATTDVITIYSTTGTCSFSAFGSEIS